MKRLIPIILTFLISEFCYTQDSTWMNFSSGIHISCLADEGEFVWVGTWNGLVKVEKSTGNITWFDKCNSGLPDNGIGAINIDSMGTKWIGTASGLAEFDDMNWTVYDTSNSGLPDNRITAIHFDRSGNKWLGTLNGIAILTPTNTWIVYNTSNSGIPGNYIIAVSTDSHDYKWIGTDGGLAMFTGSSWIVYNTSNSGLPGEIRDITVDNNDVKWIATGSGLARFYDTTWTVYNSSNSGLTINNLRTVCSDDNGNIWVGCPNGWYVNGGLFKFDQVNWTYYSQNNSGLPFDEVTDIMIDNSGKKWIGTYDGLASFDDILWQQYKTGNSGLTDEMVSCIDIAPDGNKWIGCGSDLTGFHFPGVTTTNNYTWTTFTFNNSGLKLSDIKDIVTDNAGRVYISYLFANGLSLFDGNNWQDLYDSTNNFPINRSTLERDSSGNIWIGSKGLGKYDGTSWTVYNTSNSGIPASYVLSIAIGKNGVIWFAGHSGYNYIGLVKFDGSDWTVYNTSNSQIPSNDITSIAVDGSGNVWIGTQSDGIAKFDGTNWTVFNQPFFGLNKIYIDEDDIKWIGSFDGLTRFDNVNFTTFTSNNSGLPNNVVEDIIKDVYGNLWCCTLWDGIGVFNENGIYLKERTFLTNKNDELVSFPNPFTQTTTFKIPQEYRHDGTTLTVFSYSGQKVMNESFGKNRSEILFDRKYLSSGLYLFRLTTVKGELIGQGKFVVE